MVKLPVSPFGIWQFMSMNKITYEKANNQLLKMLINKDISAILLKKVSNDRILFIPKQHGRKG